MSEREEIFIACLLHRCRKFEEEEEVEEVPPPPPPQSSSSLPSEVLARQIALLKIGKAEKEGVSSEFMHDNENQFGSERGWTLHPPPPHTVLARTAGEAEWTTVGQSGNNKLICSQRDPDPKGHFPGLTATDRRSGGRRAL